MSEVDYNRITAMKKELEKKLAGNGPKGPRLQFWIPKPGKNYIRVMPCWTQDPTSMHHGVFWREVHQHWNLTKDSKAPVTCSKLTPGIETDCVVCDFVASLRTQKGDVDANELAKTLRAKVAYLINIVDLRDPKYTETDVEKFQEDRPDDECPFVVGDAKVQVYPAGQTVFNQILGFMSENQLNLTDLEKGHDVTLTKLGTGISTKYEVLVLAKVSKAPVSKDVVLPDLANVGFAVDNDKLLQILGTNETAMSFSKHLPSGSAAKRLASTVSKPAVKATTDDDILAADLDDDDDLAGSLRSALG